MAQVLERLRLLAVRPEGSGQPGALHRASMPEDEQRQQPLGRAGAHARHRLSLYQNTHRAEQMDSQGYSSHRVVSRQTADKRVSHHSFLQYSMPVHDFPAEWNTIANT